MSLINFYTIVIVLHFFTFQENSPEATTLTPNLGRKEGPRYRFSLIVVSGKFPSVPLSLLHSWLVNSHHQMSSSWQPSFDVWRLVWFNLTSIFWVFSRQSSWIVSVFHFPLQVHTCFVLLWHTNAFFIIILFYVLFPYSLWCMNVHYLANCILVYVFSQITLLVLLKFCYDLTLHANSHCSASATTFENNININNSINFKMKP